MFFLSNVGFNKVRRELLWRQVFPRCANIYLNRHNQITRHNCLNKQQKSYCLSAGQVKFPYWRILLFNHAKTNPYRDPNFYSNIRNETACINKFGSVRKLSCRIPKLRTIEQLVSSPLNPDNPMSQIVPEIKVVELSKLLTYNLT